MKKNKDAIEFKNIIEKIELYGKSDITKVDFCYGLEEVLPLSIPSMKIAKEKRTQEDIKIIACLLTFFKLIMETLKSKHGKINEIMYSLSSNIMYRQSDGDKMILKYGEESKEYFIIITGQVNVIGLKTQSINISRIEYLRYLGLLILHQEFEVLNSVLEENYEKYKVRVCETDEEIIKNNNYVNILSKLRRSSILREIKNNQLNKNNNQNLIKNNENSSSSYAFSYFKTIDQKRPNYFHLYVSKTGEYIFSYKSLLSLVSKEAVAKYQKIKSPSLRKESNASMYITSEEYITRIMKYSNSNYNERNMPYTEYDQNLKWQVRHYPENLDKEINLSISLFEVKSQIGQGYFFGQESLLKNCKCTSTIITEDSCEFGVFNRESYLSCIREAVENQKRELIKFIENSTAFKGVPTNLLELKYFDKFTFKKVYKWDCLFSQGKLIDKVILVKSGDFEIKYSDNLHGLSNLIRYLFDSQLKNKAPNNFESDQSNYNLYLELKKKILKDIYMLVKEERLINLMQKYNSQLNDLYTKKSEIKVGIITTGELLGLNSYSNGEGVSLFNIFCTSNEGEILIMDKEYYLKQFYKSSERIRTHVDIYDYMKIVGIINRLLEVRQTKLVSVLKCKKNEIFDCINNADYTKKEEKDDGDKFGTEISLGNEKKMFNRINKSPFLMRSSSAIGIYGRNTQNYYRRLDSINFKKNDSSNGNLGNAISINGNSMNLRYNGNKNNNNFLINFNKTFFVHQGINCRSRQRGVAGLHSRASYNNISNNSKTINASSSNNVLMENINNFNSNQNINNNNNQNNASKDTNNNNTISLLDNTTNNQNNQNTKIIINSNNMLKIKKIPLNAPNNINTNYCRNLREQGCGNFLYQDSSLMNKTINNYKDESNLNLLKARYAHIFKKTPKDHGKKKENDLLPMNYESDSKHNGKNEYENLSNKLLINKSNQCGRSFSNSNFLDNSNIVLFKNKILNFSMINNSKKSSKRRETSKLRNSKSVDRINKGNIFMDGQEGDIKDITSIEFHKSLVKAPTYYDVTLPLKMESRNSTRIRSSKSYVKSRNIEVMKLTRAHFTRFKERFFYKQIKKLKK